MMERSDDICSALKLPFFTTSRLITYSKRVCAVFCMFRLSLFFESRDRMYYFFFGGGMGGGETGRGERRKEWPF